MRAEEFRNAARLLALGRFHALEHVDAGVGIVARLPEILNAQQIGFRFKRPRKVKERHGGHQAGSLPDGQTRHASEDEQGNGTHD